MCRCVLVCPDLLASCSFDVLMHGTMLIALASLQDWRLGVLIAFLVTSVRSIPEAKTFANPSYDSV